MSYVTPDNVESLIRNARDYYMRKGAYHEPNVLYLGRDENKALLLATSIYTLIGDGTPGGRRKYESMEVFVVDAQNHINFGNSDI